MSNFETWWQREGQEFLFALNTTTDDDIKLVAEIAWKNGAYGAKQAEQEPIRFVWNGEGWIEADEYIWKTTDDHERRILYAAPQPVKEVELTDGEIEKITGCRKVGGTWPVAVLVGLSLIAADREKNNANNNS